MRFKAILAVAACVVLAGATAPGAGELPGPDAAQVWNYITKTSPYRQWKSWPDYAGKQKSRSPHGVTNQVFANQIILGAKKTPVPVGSLQVKESYDEKGKLLNIVVMYKVQGFNPSAGDWFWAMYRPEGKVGTAGKPQGCVACHAVKANNDYVLVHQF